LISDRSISRLNEQNVGFGGLASVVESYRLGDLLFQSWKR